MPYFIIAAISIISGAILFFIIDRINKSNEKRKQIILATERMKACNDTGICNLSIPDLSLMDEIEDPKEAKLDNFGLFKLSTHSIFEISRFKHKANLLEKDMMEMLEQGKITEKTSILFKYELDLVLRILDRIIDVPTKNDNYLQAMSVHDMQQLCIGIKYRLEKLIPSEIDMSVNKYDNFLESTYEAISENMIPEKKRD